MGKWWRNRSCDCGANECMRYHDWRTDFMHFAMVRVDRLRGLICPACDSALDEMFNEVSP